jgi:hypothetical protein
MNYKILMDGAIPGHKAGDIIDLSESDGNSLAQWGIVEIPEDVAPTTTAPDVASVPDVAPPAVMPATVEVPATKIEVPAPTTDTGSTDAKSEAKADIADPKTKAAK